MTSVSIFMVLACIFAVAIMVLNAIICVLVYNDAKKRNMNGPLWVLITLIVPMFIGLAIYVIVRKDLSDLKCASCSEPVKEIYTACPSCGARLKAICPKCSTPLKSEWHVCPICATPIDSTQKVVSPIKEATSNRAVWIILISVILIPCLLILAVLSFSLFRKEEGDFSFGIEVVSKNECTVRLTDEAQNWLNDASSGEYKENTARILQHISSADTEKYEYHIEYVLYIPNMNNADLIIKDANNATVYYDYTVTGDILIMDFDGSYMPELEISVSGFEYAVVLDNTDSYILNDVSFAPPDSSKINAIADESAMAFFHQLISFNNGIRRLLSSLVSSHSAPVTEL